MPTNVYYHYQVYVMNHLKLIVLQKCTRPGFAPSFATNIYKRHWKGNTYFS
jgi:hypothetical protein